jgi:transcriptional regulator with XRE-family HTH domain
MRVSSIGEYIKEQREQAKISLRQLAAAAGVSNPYLSQIERGLRRPSAEILQQIAKGLRISAEALYVQAGILEDRPDESGVRVAVLADPELTERQKQVLLEIYDSFRKEASTLRAQQAAPEEPVIGAPGDAPAAAAAPAQVWATAAAEPEAGAVDPAPSAPVPPAAAEEAIDDPLAAPGPRGGEVPGDQPLTPGTSGLPTAGQEG